MRSLLSALLLVSGVSAKAASWTASLKLSSGAILDTSAFETGELVGLARPSEEVAKTVIAAVATSVRTSSRVLPKVARARRGVATALTLSGGAIAFAPREAEQLGRECGLPEPTREVVRTIKSALKGSLRKAKRLVKRKDPPPSDAKSAKTKTKEALTKRGGGDDETSFSSSSSR